MSNQYRTESDFLGSMQLDQEKLFGIHTARAGENFALSGRRVHPELVKAYGAVKQAALETCRRVGAWADDLIKAEAIVRAAGEMAAGGLAEHVVVDALQGGAGTSTNINVNEVLANRALELVGRPHGDYAYISPLDDINLYQSTNDTFPSALKLAAIRLIAALEQELVALQEAFQAKEKQFAHVVKIGRTQFQDAVLTTLGREMGAYAEAFNRDRWRVYKCQERLRVLNLGGTAIGTGLGAPRKYIFGVVEKLREITGIGFARAENLVDATQNADVFVEVSGILKACAVSLWKVSSDLRLMSSGPSGGLGEIELPQRQAGSSIMPGKVNPVIPEAVTQGAMLVIGYDQVIAMACAGGSLELNPFLPLVADCLLNGIELLAHACRILRCHCVEGICVNQEKCREYVEVSTVVATALVPALGYEKAGEIAKAAQEHGKTIRAHVLDEGIMNQEDFDALLTPEAVCRLGFI